VAEQNALWHVVFVLLACIVALPLLNVRRNRHKRRHLANLREQEQRLRLALWATREFYWDFDLASHKVSWLRGEVGPPEPHVPDEHEGPRLAKSSITVTDLVHPEDAPRLQTDLDAYLNGDTTIFQAEFRTRRPSGWRWVRARGRAVGHDRDGRIARIAGTALDISATHTAERERQIADQVLRSMSEAVAVVDDELNFVSVNPAFLRMSGYEREAIIGYNMRLLQSGAHHPARYRQIRQALDHSGHWSGELLQMHKNGEDFLCTVEFNTLERSPHAPQMHVAVFNDITMQKHTEQRLHYLTNFDPLTNLPNRSLLAERLALSIDSAWRGHHKLAVLFLDLDRFRDLNEQFSPAVGDLILREVARRLQQNVDVRHTLARLGGDEFALIVGQLDSAQTAEGIARQILVAFDTPLKLDDHLDVTVSFSIGISLYPDHAQSANQLLNQANTAMYQAKAAGRRVFMRYDGKMELETRQRVAISGTLRKVLDRDELTLAFQPRLQLTSSRITSVEVLLRWFNHEHGQISPDEFIPLAEESGMIMDIGKWALHEACLTLCDWRRRGLEDVMISVNISLMQLLRDDFAQMVQEILHTTGTPPGALELELTESILMVDTEQAASRLQAFREIGVSVAVDDFGTGYSSLAYLKRLPVNTIKIDKAFIKGLPRDPEDAAIAASIINMGHSLGLKVVAEGVETDAQKQFLVQHGCDEIQGFWLGKPMPAEKTLAFIQHWSSSAQALPFHAEAAPATPPTHPAPSAQETLPA